VDAILIIWKNILDGLVVYPKIIHKHIMAELPFMATEYIIMEGVKKGGDRQELHEKIRVHSMEAGKKVKVDGEENDLIERILKDNSFNIDKERLIEILNPVNFIGFAPQQTEDFINIEIKPILEKNAQLLGMEAELKV
jgi:adenylosuccinate lyase